MRIGIDARPLLRRRTGIGMFLSEVIRAMAQHGSGNKYFLYGASPIPAELVPAGWTVRCGNRTGRGAGTLWYHGVLPSLLKKDGIELFWSAAHILPFGLPDDIPAVLTVHDLVHLRYPETMRLLNRWQSRLLMGRSIRRSARVVCGAEHIASEVAALYGLRMQAPCRVIAEGVDTRRFNPDVNTSAAKEKYGLNGPYLLTVGTVEPRKNYPLLLNGFDSLQEKHPDLQLVIAGDAGWHSSSVIRTIRKRERVRYLDYIPDEDLPGLYAGSAGCVWTSRYEGFGLPVLEAAACGCPVVLPELPWGRNLGGRKGRYFMPDDPADLAAVLEAMLGEDEPRIIDVTHFAWRKTAAGYLEVFKEAVQG